jgi:CarD family transcriptional regulator
MYTFKVGDPVVHLSHGVGHVKGIEEREFSAGRKQRFYILEIQDNGAPKKVFVPIESSAQRLRPVINKTQAAAVYTELARKADAGVARKTWNMRYREYMEKIHTGEILAAVEVLRDLVVLKQVADLSFGERKLLDQALDLIAKELAIVEGEKVEAVRERVLATAGAHE